MSDRIRLALVITELAPGGAERCLVNLAARLDRAEFAPVVYSLAPPPGESQDLLVRQLDEAGIPTQFLGLTHWSQYFRGVGRLAGLLREQNADVVQTFLFHANVLGARAAHKAGVKRLLTGVRVADPRRWRTAVERWATSSADWIVCVSQSVADFCRTRGFPAKKLVVIPNGIEVERWQTAEPADLREWGLKVGKRVVIYVGRLDRQKGLDDLVAAFPRVLEKVPECLLLLVGEGPERVRLQRLATRLKVDEQVHFAGWRGDVPRLMAAAELLVLPSRWEGMPNVVLEAMAAGKPVVATQSEGVVELLGERASEQTVPLGDSQALADRIAAILSNPLCGIELGRANRRRAIDNFGIEAMVAQYSALFRRSDQG